jgi:WXG100 family type VII secretion target
MTSKFEFDLDEIHQVTTRVRGFSGYVTDMLDGLDDRVQQMIQAGKWTGKAADAYAEAHQVWVAAAREIADGLTDMEAAARVAHESYTEAMDVNKRMTGG